MFADADKGSNQFIEIIEKLGTELFGDKNKGKLVFIFVNPVTMQVILSHLGIVSLKTNSKKINASIIEELTGIENYDAKDEQIEELIGKIHYSNYPTMKNNIRLLSSDYKKVPSTNFMRFLDYFESDDVSWIDDIINQITKID
ncbi:MAG: hypothetical protein K6F14_04665 [Clostridiales bacterium]|nr:hypothetical protein [Clostridiales bacterium]